jgi:hypothetical protein
MKTISMKQLRQKFGPVRKALERGEKFLLMYRSKPLAVIRPYSSTTDAQYLNGQNTQTSEATNQAPNLTKLPNPNTISFGSRFDANATQSSLKPTLKPTQPAPAKPSTEPASEPSTRPSAKPLDKLGLKKAFI